MSSSENTNNKASLQGILISIGIVFGDIGTSPMYAVKESFNIGGLPLTTDIVLGVISTIVWALFIIITGKYTFFVFRANNKGEGGILVLTNSILPYLRNRKGLYGLTFILGLIGMSLFIGDSIITPAMSVMSAVEGLTVINEGFHEYTVGIAIGIIVILFMVQTFGTSKIGIVFGPIMIFWFVAIGFLGLIQVFNNFDILAALNPIRALSFITENKWYAFVSLGAIALALTGGESLYADLGHCGIKNVQFSWCFIVYPCLTLNYMGQGAELLNNPGAVANPFFMMVPKIFLIPVVILATVSSIIASQAVISGGYSVISQAIQLGYLPRLKIKFTDTVNQGQIYIGRMNYILMCAVIITILLFRNSSNLAAAYGLASTGLMTITSTLFYFFAITKLRWNRSLALLLSLVFFSLDFIFFSANLLKLLHGGWFPIVIALTMLSLFYIWIQGKKILYATTPGSDMSFKGFMEKITTMPPHIVQNRTAIFLTSTLNVVPKALLQNIVHNKVIHKKNILMKISTTEDPFVEHAKRLNVEQINEYFYKVIVFCGFKENPDMKYISQLLLQQQIIDDIQDVSFFTSNFAIQIDRENKPFYKWLLLKLFKFLYEINVKPSDYFKIMSNKVIELSTRINL